MFLLFGAANTLGFLHVSETLGHIGDPPDHFGTIFDNFSSFGLRSFSTNFPEKSYVPTPLLKTGGEEEASLLPSHVTIGCFSPPLPKMGGEEGLRFRKSPELAAYSAADSPEKIRVPKTRQSPAHNPFHRNLFSRCFRPPDHCQRLSNFSPVCFC